MEAPHTRMSRKAAEFWWGKSAAAFGRPPVAIPPDVAYYKIYSHFDGCKRVPVTWAEVMENRRKENAANLLRKRMALDFEKPALLNVFYCSANFFNGWWIYVKTVEGEYPVSFKFSGTRSARELEKQCFRIFPYGVIGELSHDAWCEAFYSEYKAPPRSFGHQKEAFAKIWVSVKRGEIVALRRYEDRANRRSRP